MTSASSLRHAGSQLTNRPPQDSTLFIPPHVVTASTADTAASIALHKLFRVGLHTVVISTINWIILRPLVAKNGISVVAVPDPRDVDIAPFPRLRNVYDLLFMTSNPERLPPEHFLPLLSGRDGARVSVKDIKLERVPDRGQRHPVLGAKLLGSGEIKDIFRTTNHVLDARAQHTGLFAAPAAEEV